ncbi:Uncharacterised protein [Moraxella caprae]|uniref:Uncharacterized protein n=1 Tax=Moraxella caprae TaxID=90240 RepID=A0A378QXR3_9GAMM|nr:hypothetical protein [Moraxella caprae]STZ07191.1 Uncharacterised protein [Moraxella caprae]
MSHPINLLTQIWQDIESMLDMQEKITVVLDGEPVTLQGRLQVSAFKLGLLVAYACMRQAIQIDTKPQTRRIYET